MEPKTVILIGPQGSGKGTQIDKIYQKLEEVDPARRAIEIQSGRRFREFGKEEQGYTAEHIRETLDTGVLQPLFLSVALWSDAFVRGVTPECHLLIDGFPRTVDEAVVLESAFEFYKRDHVYIVYLDTPEEVVRERMVSRARPDDTDESIEERLRWYREKVVPVVEYYRKREGTTVIDVDGTGSIDEVFASICSGLEL